MLEGPDGQPIAIDSVEAWGLSVCNVPVGSEAYVKAYLEQKGRKVRKGLAGVTELLDPARWPHPEVPSQHMLWILLLACLQFTGDYWIQHVCPDWTEAFAIDGGRGVVEAFEVVISTRRSEWLHYALERVTLPVRHKGLGLRGSADRRHAQYVEAVAQHPERAVPHQQDRRGEEHPQRQVPPPVCH